MRKRFIVPTLLLALPLAAQQPTLRIHPDQPLHPVSPTLYGLMTEEINHSYDGGLYAELINDRTLSDDWQALAHWTAVEHGNSQSKISVDKEVAATKALPRSLKVEIVSATAAKPAGVQNDGFWGIAVRPGTRYDGSLLVRGSADHLPVTLELVNDQTGEVAAKTTVEISSGWQTIPYTLQTGKVATSANNHLQILFDRPATAWFGLVSLFPPTYHDRQHGFRRDLMEMQAAMSPRFLRLPGGNYLEGNHINERFEWKKTIGPWSERPTHPSPWSYRSSDGMGLLEYLQWCEDLKIEPVLAVYAGYSLSQEHVNAGKDLEPYVQDALDEIEYLTGSTSTQWGAVRAQNGHPAPFTLHYVEIGNEDMFDHSNSYEGRYEQFYKAIKARYPELQLIATMPLKQFKPDVQDDHYYMSAQESYEKTTLYDKTDRKGPKIFVGEWATREGDPTPNLNAALADAAWMTGLERNSDIIVMASYAPLFVNVNPGAMQWATDLIGYDAEKAYGSPSYWAQVLFGSHLGNEVVATDLTDAGRHVFASVTRDAAKHMLYIKLVNGGSEAVDLKLDAGSKAGQTAHQWTLSGRTPSATNTINEPRNIVPVESTFNVTGATFTRTLAPYSINVIEVAN